MSGKETWFITGAGRGIDAVRSHHGRERGEAVGFDWTEGRFIGDVLGCHRSGYACRT